jgi:hypothetical protein
MEKKKKKGTAPILHACLPNALSATERVVDMTCPLGNSDDVA